MKSYWLIKIFFCIGLMETLIILAVYSQDIHFSQAYSAHLTLNPANTGRFNGDWRASGMYRSQGYQITDPYQTYYLSFEKPIYIKNEVINAGFFYSHDNSAGQTLPVERAYFMLGNEVKFNTNTFLSFGIQAGFVFKQVINSGLSLPDQYNRDLGRFDPTLPTGDQFENTSKSYLDLGFGLLLSHKFEKNIFSLGAAFHQVNKPTEGYFGIETPLPIKMIYHAKADINLGTSFFVIPAIVTVLQQKSSETLIGGHLGYNLSSNTGNVRNVIGGLHLRNGIFSKAESVIVSSGLTYQFWTFLMSYDWDVSGLKTSSVKSSAIEFSMIYTLPSTNLTHRTVSCERY